MTWPALVPTQVMFFTIAFFARSRRSARTYHIFLIPSRVGHALPEHEEGAAPPPSHVTFELPILAAPSHGRQPHDLKVVRHTALETRQEVHQAASA